MLVVPLLGLTVFGCGPSSKHYQATTSQVAVGPLFVSYRGTFSEAQRHACENSIAAVISEWQVRETVPVPRISVEVFSPEIALDAAPGLAGFSYNGRGRIQVVAWYQGYEWGCPATYHELAHYAYDLWDHDDPRWIEWSAISWSIGAANARPDVE